MLPRKPSICVLISGQMRGFETPLQSLQKALTKFDATYFVSTWKRRGCKVIGAWYIDQIQRLLPAPVTRLFPYAFMQPTAFAGIPALSRLLAERNARSEIITGEAITAILPESHVHIDDEGLLDSTLKNIVFYEPNSYRMLYKLNQCAGMVAEFERTQGFSFDYFLRIRPDLLVPENLLDAFEALEKGIIIADNVDEPGRAVGDSLAWGHRVDLDAYVAVAIRLQNGIDRKADLTKWRGIHHELYESVYSENRALKSANPSGHIVEEFVTIEEILDCVEKSMNEVGAREKDELSCFKNSWFALDSIKQNNFSAAARYANTAIMFRPNSPTAFYLLAQAMEGIGNRTDAFVAAVKSLAYSSDHWSHNYLLEYANGLMHRLHDKQKSIQIVEAAFKSAENRSRLDALLALIEEHYSAIS